MTIAKTFKKMSSKFCLLSFHFYFILKGPDQYFRMAFVQLWQSLRRLQKLPTLLIIKLWDSINSLFLKCCCTGLKCIITVYSLRAHHAIHTLHFSLLLGNTAIVPHRLLLKKLKFTGKLFLNSHRPTRLLQLWEELLLLSHKKGERKGSCSRWQSSK